MKKKTIKYYSSQQTATPTNFFAAFRVTFLMPQAGFKPVTWYFEMDHVKTFFHIVVTNHDFWFVLVFGCLILLCITLRQLLPTYVKKLKEVQMLLFQTSREIIFYFQHFKQVCFYFLGKKTCSVCCEYKPVLTLLLIQLC